MMGQQEWDAMESAKTILAIERLARHDEKEFLRIRTRTQANSSKDQP
jgi:hypothetical protein